MHNVRHSLPGLFGDKNGRDQEGEGSKQWLLSRSKCPQMLNTLAQGVR